MQLPPYKRPLFKIVVRHMWDRSKLFLRRAGTVILGISILLWFLATYPRNSRTEQELARQRQAIEADASLDAKVKDEALSALQKQEAGAGLRNSFAGRLGHLIEPAIRPLGFDWQIGIGLIASFAAREVFVSTMSTVYNVGSETDDNTDNLADVLRQQKRDDGSLIYTPLVGVTLMVFY